MNLLDIRHIAAFSASCEFDGDFDGGRYTLNLHYVGDHCPHEKIEYVLKPGDYDELIYGMEYLLKILKEKKG